MLTGCEVIAFVATANSERAKAFYTNVLGLTLVADTPFALVFDAAGTMLRISKVEKLAPAPHTVLGWKVVDIDATIEQLTEAGATFELYAHMPQDKLGVWTTPEGHKIAWFKDPDGNTLSLTQFRA